MSRRTYSPNGLEPKLSSGITGSSTSIPLDSVAGLDVTGKGGYMVIDPDNITKREYFKFETINASSLETLTRGLAGSAAGAVSHDSGATVRQVFASQALNDIWSDIEEAQTDITSHAGAADPHPVYLTAVEGDSAYVNENGDTMTGPLILNADPVAALGAATKQSFEAYADGKDHDHATPIGVHAALPEVHHTKYTDAEAIVATAGEYLPIAGVANEATILETARTIDITGDITATAVPFDGSANISINAAVNNDSHTHDARYYTESEVNTKVNARMLPHTGTDSQVIVSTGSPSGGQNGDIWLKV